MAGVFMCVCPCLGQHPERAWFCGCGDLGREDKREKSEGFSSALNAATRIRDLECFHLSVHMSAVKQYFTVLLILSVSVMDRAFT